MSKEYTVYINNLNYLQSPFITDAERPIVITEEEFNKIRQFKSEQAWQWDENTNTFVSVANPNFIALRFAREVECFSIVNRSPLWLETLTEEQRAEVKKWYRDWLDVTETGVIPKKPTWLK